MDNIIVFILSFLKSLFTTSLIGTLINFILATYLYRRGIKKHDTNPNSLSVFIPSMCLLFFTGIVGVILAIIVYKDIN